MSSGTFADDVTALLLNLGWQKTGHGGWRHPDHPRLTQWPLTLEVAATRQLLYEQTGLAPFPPYEPPR